MGTEPFPRQFFRIFELADRQKMADTRQPFHRLAHLKPTNLPLYYNPKFGSIRLVHIECSMHTLLRIISGAKYSGVPHKVQVRPLTRLAKPKSVT